MDASAEPRGTTDLLEQPAVAALAAALRALCATGTVHILPPGLRTPEQVAAHLGVPRAALATCVVLVPPPAAEPPRPPLPSYLSLIPRRRARLQAHVSTADTGCGDGAVLVVTSAVHRVVPEQIADVLGVPALQVADAAPVLQGTRSLVAGVAPLGHPVPLVTLVDVALATQRVVWAPAGHPRAVFPTRYDELLRLTGGQPVEVG